MSRKQNASHPVNIAGLTNAVELFHMLGEAIDDYLSDVLSTRKAVMCAMFAWHLTDWVQAEHPKHPTRRTLQDEARRHCPALSYMRDIVTAAKHRSIRAWVSAVKSADAHRGAFSRGFSTGFDIPCLMLELADGSVVYFDEEVIKSRDFWHDYFSTALHVSV